MGESGVTNQQTITKNMSVSGPAQEGDYRISKRSRPVVGTNRASFFNLELLATVQQDMGFGWIGQIKMEFAFLFASILEHTDPAQQLSDGDLGKLFNGDEKFKDLQIGLPAIHIAWPVLHRVVQAWFRCGS